MMIELRGTLSHERGVTDSAVTATGVSSIASSCSSYKLSTEMILQIGIRNLCFRISFIDVTSTSFAFRHFVVSPYSDRYNKLSDVHIVLPFRGMAFHMLWETII